MEGDENHGLTPTATQCHPFGVCKQNDIGPFVDTYVVWQGRAIARGGEAVGLSVPTK